MSKLAQDWASQGEWEEAMSRHTCRDPHGCSSSAHRDDERDEEEATAYAVHETEHLTCECCPVDGCLWCEDDQHDEVMSNH